MKILHIAHTLIRGSGISVFVGEVAREQAVLGHDVRVWCWGWIEYPTGTARCELRPKLPRRIEVDWAHVHGLWTGYCAKAMWLCWRSGVPFAVSPHGGLMPRVFTKGRVKKFLVWHLLLKPLVKRAALIHCTSEAEADACRARGLKGPFVVAPLGVRVKRSEKCEVRSEKCGGEGDGNALRGCERKAAAEKKVEEWLEGVDEDAFGAALEKLVAEKSAAGEYRFKRPDERELALEGARKFYREFARKIVPLSDGRYVYFAPDERAKTRNASNAISWAEYAFHAVSNGGKKVVGKNYNERWYSPYKQPAFNLIEAVLKQEHCFIRLSSVAHRYDAIVFAGDDPTAKGLQVVTRLDEAGNVDANLSEVTFTASSKEKKSPRLVPLAEAVRTVVHYQITAGSYPTDEGSIAESALARKGGERSEKCEVKSEKLGPRTVLFLGRLGEEKGLVGLLDAWREICGARLVIAGPDWRGFGANLRRKVAEEKIPNVVFAGPADEEMKDRLYRAADIFVLPSPMENFSMVVLEALAYGVPVIATKGTPWAELESEQCGLWIEQGVEPLREALVQLLNLPAAQLRALGANGRALAARKYQWPAIAEKLISSYGSVVQSND